MAALVGYLSGSRTVGGTERYLRELAGSVDRRRFQPVFLRPPSLAGFYADGVGAGIPQVDLPTWEPAGMAILGGRGRSLVGMASRATVLSRLQGAAGPLAKQLATEVSRYRLSKVLARLDLDLLHVHNGGHPGSPTALAAALAAGDAGIPTVLTVHGMPKARGVPAGAGALLDRRIGMAITAVTTVGDAPARALAGLRGFDQASIRVVTTGINVPPVVTPRLAARALLGVDPNLPVVGSVAAFIPAKGHAALLESLVLVQLRVPHLRAVLAGDGPCRTQVAERAAALGLAGSIVLPGSVDPFATLAAFDVFVSASTTEGLPLSVLEAMSQGIPVVATAVGAVPEAVVQGETGFLVAPGDIDGLAQRVVEVLADPALARRLGEAGRRRFDAGHHIGAMVAAFERIYHEVLGHPQ